MIASRNRIQKCFVRSSWDTHTRVARNARRSSAAWFALLTVMPSNLNSTVLHHNSDNKIDVTKNDILALLRKDQA